ncbi:hypothetical protein BOX15_Mlig002186g1 [Macrostomum lignano]|uniref:1-acyl-sn-glycerol-3-phosphate acyltransferase n=1 Tax=Macrostomum lignano TaxID=282301 RepID=A0A267H690_9PLAT|nr:hypothetical protein BOX15_Mlig002186g1 [Macrostomum lignano]
MYIILQYLGACLFIFITFSFVIIPMLPNAWQYRTKMSVYYMLLLIYGFITTILALATPRQLSNYKYPMATLAFTRWLYGLRYRVNNLARLRQLQGSYVLVSNHQSSIDLMGVGLLWPYQCTIVAKKSLMFAGWFGLAAWLCGCVFVSRGRQSAQAEMRRLAARMARRDDTVRVWIFPEGTRVSGADLGDFKKGAFHLAVQAQVPVVPIVFSNYSSFYSKWSGRFQQGEVEATVLEPLPTAGLTEADVADLTKRVRDAMSAEYSRLSAASDCKAD